MRDEKRMMRREMLILPPPGSPAATVGAEVWEGRRPPPPHPQLAAWLGAVISGPRGKYKGKPLLCLFPAF